MKFIPDPVVEPALSIEHDADRDQWVLYVSDEHARRGIVLTEGLVDTLAARVAAQRQGQPTEDGWYAYSGGAQAMVFRLTRGQWYVATDSGEMNPCAWGYIEQALSVWNLVPLKP